MYETFFQCNQDYAYDWMLFNHFAESGNSSDVSLYDGFVCSAEEASNWRFNLGSAKSVNVDVHAAHWLADWWIAPTNPWPWGGCCYDEDLHHGVNEFTSTRLHTYCGGVEHD
jgi:hypothetical protein